MEVVDVDEMEARYEKSANAKSLKERLEKAKAASEQKAKTIPMTMRIKSITRNTPKTKAPARKTKLNEPEIQEGIKKIILRGFSMPMKGEKREKLCKRLEQSKFMGQYINDHLYTDYLDGFNDHYKAALVYSYHFLDVLVSADEPRMSLPQAQQELRAE